MTDTKSPAPIDSAKVEDTGEPDMQRHETIMSLIVSYGFYRAQYMRGGNELDLDTATSIFSKIGDHLAAPRLPNTTPSTQAVEDTGEPVWQVWDGDTCSWHDVTPEYYAERLPSNRRILYTATPTPSTQVVGEPEGLHDEIGAALQIALTSGAEQPDWYDAREIDRLADAVITVLPTSSVATPMGSVPVATVLNGAVHWNNETALPHGTLIYAAPASPAPICATCNDHGMIGGPSFYAPDEGGEPCPDCYAAPTTGSEPWQVGDDTSSVQISRDGSTHKWGCKCEGCAPTTGSAPDAEAVAWRMPNAFSRHRHDKWHISQDLDDFPENGEWLYAASPAASVLTDDRIRELLGATATCTEDLNQPINLEWMRAFGIALLAASMGGDKL